MLLAKRSIRGTMRMSPGRIKSKRVRSSVLPWRVVPVNFSCQITSHPASFSLVTWMVRSWSAVETRAYQYVAMRLAPACLSYYVPDRRFMVFQKSEFNPKNTRFMSQ